MSTKIIFTSNEKYSDAVLFTGLPGIGLVGKIVVDYLLKQLKMKKVGEIVSDSFPPSVYTKNGVIQLIKDEIYFFELNKKKFLFLAGPIQPPLDSKTESSKEHYDFAFSIVSEMKKKGVKEIITLAGINIGEKRVSKKPGVVVAATSKKILDEWKKLGAVNNRPEGLISGAAGLILGLAKNEGIEGACLMGETSINLVYGDPGAAKSLLELLLKKYKFNVKMTSLEKEVTEIEDAFKQLSQQLEEQTEAQQNERPSYVR
ncbi:MAG: PAC2 family protein [Candidatus Diapherotrites archaeon]|nr:PAC2 family protein [Candidatus Diapherotrites archaeon]